MKPMRLLTLGILALFACEEATSPTVEEPDLRPSFAVTTTTSGITFVDLGFLGGGTYSLAEGINNKGEVVGRARTASGDRRAFYWTVKDGMVDLGLPPGHAWGYATEINEAGQVAGRGAAPGGYVEPWLRDTDGHFTVFQLPEGWGSGWTTSINEVGEVAGVARNEAGSRQGWVWTRKAGLRVLGPFEGDENGAREINNHGQVAGWIRVIGEGFRPFVWSDPKGLTYPLPGIDPDDAGSRAWSMNEKGMIQGYSWSPSGAYGGWLWSPELGMMDLEPLGSLGHDQAWAADINHRGDVSGVSFSGNDCYLTPNNCRAVFYPFGGDPVDLGQPDGWEWSEAWAVNDKGQLVGNAVDADGFSHAVMWIVDNDGG